MISFSRALDSESRERGVRVKAICPGGISTQFHINAGLDNKIVEDNKNFMETPENIASDILKLIDGDCEIYIPRYYNKLIRIFSRLLPTHYLAQQTKSLYKKYLPK